MVAYTHPTCYKLFLCLLHTHTICCKDSRGMLQMLHSCCNFFLMQNFVLHTQKMMHRFILQMLRTFLAFGVNDENAAKMLQM
jgi:hypothetical protein